ncbi:MAG TPA: phosphoglycerate kinase [Gemmatimonadales bacterium]|nr:phosphoglycerate kinase [Gemmatimonadales bacterium]
MPKRTLAQLEHSGLDGKRALVRVDFNVPLKDGAVSDDTRIRAAIPTIRRLKSMGCRIVLLSHLGRPKGGGYEEKYSLKPVARALESLLGEPVTFVADATSSDAEQTTRLLPRGGVALVENTRFLPGEERNDPAVARLLAALGDFYVNDAFGSAHRAHASTEAVAHLLKPAVAGLLMQKELDYLGAALADPKRPFVAVLGGAKISGKIDVIENLLPRVDRIIIGGAMACTFFRGRGADVGASLIEEDRVEMARELMERAGAKLVLPAGGVIAQSLEQPEPNREVTWNQVPAGWAIYDIDSGSREQFASIIREAKTVVWNGPMGVFETKPFDAGTLAVARALAEATKAGATTVVGGGDSAAAITAAGLEAQVSHVSTGGGASLEFLEGKKLPGVEALDNA